MAWSDEARQAAAEARSKGGARTDHLSPVPNSGGKFPAFDNYWKGSAGASVDNKAAASALAGGGAKSSPAPVHDAMGGHIGHPLSVDVADRIRAGATVSDAIHDVLGRVRDSTRPRTSVILNDLNNMGLFKPSGRR